MEFLNEDDGGDVDQRELQRGLKASREEYEREQARKDELQSGARWLGCKWRHY